jgi:uncharacterized protein YndB with AHSA1/START domain
MSAFSSKGAAMKTSEEPVVVEQNFDRSIEDLWNALVRVDEMRQWYFDNIPDFQPEPGFTTEFVVKSDTREFPHQWLVTEVIPGCRIVYNWIYKGYEGDADAIFELEGDSRKSHLRVTMKVLADFPDEIPEFARESCLGGWNYFIGESLKAYLDGK